MQSFFRINKACKSLNVLIVEDEALVALEIEGMLAMAGHHAVGQADDQESAVRLAEQCHPDLALVDVHLANGSSGLDVARELLARGIPVLFATGNMIDDEGLGLALGCVHKPITDRGLATALARAETMLAEDAGPRQHRQALHFY